MNAIAPPSSSGKKMDAYYQLPSAYLALQFFNQFCCSIISKELLFQTILLNDLN